MTTKKITDNNICSKKNKSIKIEDINYTLYGDGSYWIHYTFDKSTGYEITHEYGPGSEDILQLRCNIEKDLREKYLNKIQINKCSDFMQMLIKKCLESCDDFFFLQDNEIEGILEKYHTSINELKDEIAALNLDEYVVCDKERMPESIAVIVYGQSITKFLF